MKITFSFSLQSPLQKYLQWSENKPKTSRKFHGYCNQRCCKHSPLNFKIKKIEKDRKERIILHNCEKT